MEQIYFSNTEKEEKQKWFEIYNPTSETIDLSNYALPSVSNGSDGTYEYWNIFADGATIASRDVYVVAHPSADEDIRNKTNETYNIISNGDDGMKLVKKIVGSPNWDTTDETTKRILILVSIR